MKPDFSSLTHPNTCPHRRKREGKKEGRRGRECKREEMMWVEKGNKMGTRDGGKERERVHRERERERERERKLRE